MAELTPKTINELPLASSLGANDLIPISSGGEAKRLPGSAIMAESGSGYAKFPDGTMIQWGTASITSGTFSQIGSSGVFSLAISFFFPAQFSGSPRVSGTARYSTGYAVPAGFNDSSNTTAKGFAYDFFARAPSAQVQLVIEWMAVGRWK